MTDKSQLAEQLAAVPVFAGLSRRQLSKLVDKSKETRHPAGHELAREGAGSLALHLITSGTAHISIHGESKRTLKQGDYFGEISLIDGKPRSATVTAETDLTTLAVPHIAFQQLLEEEPGFAAGLLKLVCERLREAEAR
jgi:CRP-like cAMP-binding protein